MTVVFSLLSLTLTFVILTGPGLSIEIGSSRWLRDICTRLFYLTSELYFAAALSGVLSIPRTDAGSTLLLLSASTLFSGIGRSGDILTPGLCLSIIFETIWMLLYPIMILSTFALPLSAVVSYEDRGFGVFGLICDIKLVLGWKNSCARTWLGLGLFLGL